jgi:hypothetical protein
MTENIDTLVKTRDADGLRRLLLSQADTLRQTRQMRDTYRYLLLVPDPWLRDLMRHDLANVWFLAFKRLYPSELLAAYEYDYYARLSGTHRNDARNESYLCIDFALSVNFANANGPEPGVYGKEFFVRLAESGGEETLEDKWYDQQSQQQFDSRESALASPLRPSSHHDHWTWFHISMRRVAFHLIHRVAQTCGNAALVALYDYAALMRDMQWTSDEALLGMNAGDAALFTPTVEFFCPPDNALIGGDNPLYGAEEWRRLVQDVVLLVEQGMPAGVAMTDCVLDSFFSSRSRDDASDTLIDLPFIYDGSLKMQTAFETLISRL